MSRAVDVVVRARAKINIGWLVGERRGDGYHSVQGMIQTIDLADELRITSGGDVSTSAGAEIAVDLDGAELSLRCEGHVPGEDDLVIAAARALAARGAPRATRIELRKTIPIAAGLGGGSADAAGALAGLNLAWGAGLNPKQLLGLAAEVGSDVPALLTGGLVHVSGRGERVRRIGSADAGAFVLGISAQGLGTADVYEALDANRAEASDAIRSGWSPIQHNDLEAAAVALRPSLGAQLEAMRAVAPAAFVTGSGPTVVGACPSIEHAREVADRVRDPFDRVLVVAPSPWGIDVSVGRGAPS